MCKVASRQKNGNETWESTNWDHQKFSKRLQKREQKNSQKSKKDEGKTNANT